VRQPGELGLGGRGVKLSSTCLVAVEAKRFRQIRKPPVHKTHENADDLCVGESLSELAIFPAFSERAATVVRRTCLVRGNVQVDSPPGVNYLTADFADRRPAPLPTARPRHGPLRIPRKRLACRSITSQMQGESPDSSVQAIPKFSIRKKSKSST